MKRALLLVTAVAVMIAQQATIQNQTYQQPYDRASVRPLQNKIAEIVSVADFAPPGTEVCNGGDDTEAFRAAGAASSVHHIIVSLPGATCTVGSWTYGDDVSLQGNPNGLSVILQKPGNITQSNNVWIQNAGDQTAGNSNISFRDITFDGNIAYQSGDTEWYAFVAGGLKNSTFSNVQIKNSPIGVEIYGMTNSRIDKFRCSNAGNNGRMCLNFDDNRGFMGGSRAVWITDANIDGTLGGGGCINIQNLGAGPSANPESDINIDRLYCVNGGKPNRGVTLAVQIHGYKMQRINVTNSIITAPSFAVGTTANTFGLSAPNCDYCIISGNRIQWQGAVGIEWDGNSGVVADNVFYQSAGMLINNSTDTVIKGNTMFQPVSYSGAENAAGIHVQTVGTSGNFSNNQIVNNIVDASAGPGGSGVYIWCHSSSGKISGNIVSGNVLIGPGAGVGKTFGIYLNNQNAACTYDGNQIANNSVSNYASGIVGDSSNRITNSLVSNNVLTNITNPNYTNIQAHLPQTPWPCNDTSGSATAQVCNTTVKFTPSTGDLLLYTTTTAVGDNPVLTMNGTAYRLKKRQGQASLAANDIRANEPVILISDGVNLVLSSLLGN